MAVYFSSNGYIKLKRSLRSRTLTTNFFWRFISTTAPIGCTAAITHQQTYGMFTLLARIQSQGLLLWALVKTRKCLSGSAKIEYGGHHLLQMKRSEQRGDGLNNAISTLSRQYQKAPLIFTSDVNLCLIISYRPGWFAFLNLMRLLSKSWKRRALGMWLGAVSATAGVGLRKSKPHRTTLEMAGGRYGYRTYHEQSVMQSWLLGTSMFAIFG